MATVLDIMATMATPLEVTTMARDLLRLSLLLPLLLRPRLIPICCTEDTTATVLDIMATPMDMSTESKSNARTEENEVPTFLTTTCQMFSTSEKNQKTKHPHSSNKLHLNIYTF